MKRVLKGLLMVLLFVPLYVKADLIVTQFNEADYYVVVTDKNGVDYYSDSSLKEKVGTYKKDTRLGVLFEASTKDKTIFGVAARKDGNNFYYIEAQGIAVLEEDYNPEDFGSYGKPVNYKIEGGEVAVRKGPSVLFEEVGKLKDGTTGKYEYSYQGEWFYVEKDGVKGWVDPADDAVFIQKVAYLTLEDIKTDCGTIPAYTKLAYKWLNTTKDDVIIYTKYKKCDLKISTKENKLEDFNYTLLKGIVNTEVVLYKDFDLTKEIRTLKEDEKVYIIATVMGERSYDEHSKNFVMTEDEVEGWVPILIPEEDKFVPTFNSDGEADYKEVFPNEEEEEAEEEPSKEEKHDKKKDPKKLDSKTVVLVCVIAGVAFAMGALTSIILVNKKKNKKEEV